MRTTPWIVWRNTLLVLLLVHFHRHRPIWSEERSSICRKKKTWGNLMLLIKYLWKHVALLTTCSSFKKAIHAYTFHGTFHSRGMFKGVLWLSHSQPFRMEEAKCYTQFLQIVSTQHSRALAIKIQSCRMLGLRVTTLLHARTTDNLLNSECIVELINFRTYKDRGNRHVWGNCRFNEKKRISTFIVFSLKTTHCYRHTHLSTGNSIFKIQNDAMYYFVGKINRPIN